MKYIVGSLIISFGILLVLLIIAIAMNFQAPENSGRYFMMAWVVLAVCTYPLAKKLVRD